MLKTRGAEDNENIERRYLHLTKGTCKQKLKGTEGCYKMTRQCGENKPSSKGAEKTTHRSKRFF